MPAIGYCRVSTNGQAEEGFGLDVQEAQVRAVAKANHGRLRGIFRDVGVSGAISDRPGLNDLLEAVAPGTVVIIPRLDRLARELTVQEGVLAHIWRLGGRVFTADGGEVLADGPDDPMRTAMRQMVGVFAQLERAMIAKRMRDGRRKKRELGGYAYGAPGYGYKAEGRALVPAPDVGPTVALAVRLRAEGRSLREIARALDEAGYKPRKAARWNPETVSRIIERAVRGTGSKGNGKR
jgi:DNA invertase Pin-like site-specific DNA recombinase